jgi:hypothetical protein
MSAQESVSLGSSGDDKVTVAKITAIQAVLVALIALFGSAVTGVTGYLIARQTVPVQTGPIGVVPQNPDVKTVPKLNEESSDGFQTLRDISVFDLRGWKQLSASETNPRVSPANYINYLHVKKTHDVKTYRAHYATSGTGIDLRCITHQAQVLQEATPVEHSGQKVREYEVDVDISEVPVDKEFLIVIEGTYWNSFQNLIEETASTYTNDDIAQLDELSIFVLLPESRPFKGYKLWSQSSGGGERSEYRGDNRLYADQNGHFLYWSILARKPDQHYQVSWNW